MRPYAAILVIIILTHLLGGCVNTRQDYQETNFFQETWISNIDTKVDPWAVGADQWFFKGDKGIPVKPWNLRTVSVPRFTNIKVNGAFQVQIQGSKDTNSVVVQGPYQAVLAVSVKVIANTLCLSPIAPVPDNMNRVTVRIRMANLNNLNHQGQGRIEAAHVHSHDLSLQSSGGGDIYLQGDVVLSRIFQQGSGSISVFGAKAHQLDIQAAGTGDVGVSGKINLRSIIRHGCGEVNIIGAEGNLLKIAADGESKVGLRGRVNVHKILAKNEAHIYIYQSSSDTIDAKIQDEAEVGIAGVTTNLYVNALNEGIFYGRQLRAQNAFVKTQDNSHINVKATNKIYADANQHSSIYFFGPSTILSKSTQDQAVILTLSNSQSFDDKRYNSVFFDH